MILKPNKASNSPTSYRPISLLPVIGKLFERLISTNLTLYMIENGLINKYQCGFRTKKSTVHQLIRLAEFISKSFNKKPKGRTVSIYIDAEKAFESVWHDGLRKMTNDAKLPSKMIRILSSFLNNRFGCIQVNECLSRKVLLTAGVPQGSILAPLLYIFFIREMPTVISNEISSSFFADDTSYSASDNTHKNRTVFVSEHLQKILIELETLCGKWRIKLNAEKTWCQNFFINSENDNTPCLWLKGELLKYRKTCKFLGVTFDQKLTFTEHVNDIVNRSKKRLNLLKALRGQTWGASPETLLYSYRTFVRPLMDYSCILFSHSSNTLLKKLQAVETSAIKLVYRLAPWATNSYCYSLVTFTPILDRLKMQSKKFIENYKNDELIKPLLEDIKPSMTGHHSVLFKAVNF